MGMKLSKELEQTIFSRCEPPRTVNTEAFTTKSVKLPQLTEKDFQTRIIDLAHEHGWMVYHQRPAWIRAEKKMVTPLQGDKGFPDLVLAHGERQLVIFAELKSDTGTIDREQQKWHDTLQRAAGRSPGVLVQFWYPEDWPSISTILKGQT